MACGRIPTGRPCWGPIGVVKYLPTMIDVMVKEYRYNPRIKMIRQFEDALAMWKHDSPAGRLIVDGFARAAMESEILSDVGRYHPVAQVDLWIEGLKKAELGL